MSEEGRQGWALMDGLTLMLMRRGSLMSHAASQVCGEAVCVCGKGLVLSVVGLFAQLVRARAGPPLSFAAMILVLFIMYARSVRAAA